MRWLIEYVLSKNVGLSLKNIMLPQAKALTSESPEKLFELLKLLY